ncbi:hypothetical protein JMUB7544_01990 [Staphylococcus aureus]
MSILRIFRLIYTQSLGFNCHAYPHAQPVRYAYIKYNAHQGTYSNVNLNRRLFIVK